MSEPMSVEVQSPEKESKPKLSRAQIRDKERRELEAKGTYESLTKAFWNIFLNCVDPEGEELKTIQKSYDSRWRVYCKRSNLMVSAYNMINEYADNLLKEYKETKAE